jgi:hypothetical protein
MNEKQKRIFKVSVSMLISEDNTFLASVLNHNGKTLTEVLEHPYELQEIMGETFNRYLERDASYDPYVVEEVHVDCLPSAFIHVWDDKKGDIQHTS